MQNGKIELNDKVEFVVNEIIWWCIDIGKNYQCLMDIEPERIRRIASILDINLNDEEIKEIRQRLAHLYYSRYVSR